MIIESVCGEQISIVENKYGLLVDTHGRWWNRNSDEDVPDKAAAYTNNDIGDTILLNRPMLKRACQGNNAIQQLTTVAEMRDYIGRLRSDLRTAGDNMNDQQLREILIEAETDGKSCLNLLLCRLNTESNKYITAETEECVSCETGGTSLEPERPTGTDVPPKKKAKRKPKEYAFEGTCDGVDVRLTLKQVLVLQAVLDCTDTNLNCSTANVLQYVAKDIPPISAGAVLSTLKEKGIISVDKVAGTVSPTGLGARVLNIFKGGTNDEQGS
jgi:hypothetical protein